MARYQLGPEPPARFLTLRPVKHEYVLSSHRRAVKAISAPVACSGAHCRNASSCHGGKEITPGRAPRGRLSISHMYYDHVIFLVNFQDSPVIGIAQSRGTEQSILEEPGTHLHTRRGHSRRLSDTPAPACILPPPAHAFLSLFIVYRRMVGKR